MSDGVRPPRVAVAFLGDGLDPSAWSGTPFGIFEGSAQPAPTRWR